MCVPGCMEAVHATLSRRNFFRGATAAGFAATALSSLEAEAKTVKLKEKSDASAERAESYFKAVLDLTHTMSPEFPTFFGVPGIELQKQYDYKKDGFNLNWWRIVEHAGTHLDAPIHFSENGITVEKIVAGELVVPLAAILLGFSAFAADRERIKTPSPSTANSPMKNAWCATAPATSHARGFYRALSLPTGTNSSTPPSCAIWARRGCLAAPSMAMAAQG